MVTILVYAVTKNGLLSFYERIRYCIKTTNKSIFMRRTLFVLTAGIFLLHVAKAQNNKESNHRETIEGNGKVITRNVPVKSFNELEASGVYELRLTQGEKEEVKIEADENLQELFTVANEGSRLVIDTKKLKDKNLKGKVKMKVYVTFKKLKSMDLGTVGSVNSENQLAFDNLEFNNSSVGNVNLKLNANKINLSNKSVGNVELTGKAQEAVFKNNGVGNLQASEFVVQTMDIDNSGIGNAAVNAQKTLKVKDSFLGKVSNKGASAVRKMNKVSI